VSRCICRKPGASVTIETMIHVLMISVDTTLAIQPESDARRRHLAYARRAGRLSIIVYTPPGVGPALQPSPELTILPTNSASKLTFAIDALKQARIVLRTEKINLITTQDPFLTGLIGVWLRYRLRVPLLVQNHSYYFGNTAWIAEHPLRNSLLS